MKNEDPLLSPCKGEAIYVLRLAVYQLRQRDFSLFTFHSSLFTKRNVTSILHSSFFIYNISYFFLTGSQESPIPSFLKILRSTSLSITVE